MSSEGTNDSHILNKSLPNISTTEANSTEAERRAKGKNDKGKHEDHPDDDPEEDSKSFTLECSAASGNFPMKLHHMLSNESTYGQIIGWQSHGRSWKVHDRTAFEKSIIPKYFNQTKFSSFTRQVNGWGFKRITSGPDRDSYFHENFVRGRPQLSLSMKRRKKNQGFDPFMTAPVAELHGDPSHLQTGEMGGGGNLNPNQIAAVGQYDSINLLLAQQQQQQPMMRSIPNIVNSSGFLSHNPVINNTAKAGSLQYLGPDCGHLIHGGQPNHFNLQPIKGNGVYYPGQIPATGASNYSMMLSHGNTSQPGMQNFSSSLTPSQAHFLLQQQLQVPIQTQHDTKNMDGPSFKYLGLGADNLMSGSQLHQPSFENSPRAAESSPVSEGINSEK